MIPKTYSLETIAHAVDIAVTLRDSWFRGHSAVHGELTPRIFRSDLTWVQGHSRGAVFTLEKQLSEIKAIERFKQEAPVLAKESLPDRHDYLGWLYLMQHYLAPTRLLDWTENALVALYFAVRENTDCDGELWAMHPHLLNKESYIGEGLPLIDHNPVLRYLVEEAYWAADKKDLAEKIGLTIIPDRPVAFMPRRNFARMVAQASTFTIHPDPERAEPIPNILKDEKAFVRYIVPFAQKEPLRHALHCLGIVRSQLFPDPAGLAGQVLLETLEESESGYPSPPHCGGVIELATDG